MRTAILAAIFLVSVALFVGVLAERHRAAEGARPGTTITVNSGDLVWGDHNCSGAADPVDALLTLRHDAGLDTDTGECPDMGQVVDVESASPHTWGDVDCGGDVTPVDSLKLLRYDAGLAVNQPQGCPGIGQRVLIGEPQGGLTIDVDQSVQPSQESLPPFGDGIPRPVSSIQDENGDQFDFVSNEMFVLAENEEALNAFLDEYDGVILDDDVIGPSGAAAQPAAFDLSPKLARVSPKDLDKEVIEQQVHLINPGRTGSFKVSDLEGMKLLGSVAEAMKAGGVKANPHWVNYEEPFAYGPVFELGEYLTPNCSYQLMQELQLIEQLARGETTPDQALQQLGQRIGDPSECETPLPQYNLVDGLVLDEIEPGQPAAIILTPPASVPSGFTAEITSAIGSFSANTLFGGSLRLDTDGNQLALATPETFEIPICARSEEFTVELSYSGGSQSFDVVLPVAFRLQPLDVLLAPGVATNIPLCASGDRGPRDWSWVQPEGDPFPPPGLALGAAGDGDAQIVGSPNVNSWSSRGRLHVEQSGDVAEAPASVQVAVLFHQTIGDACPSRYELEPGQPFECELPRPIDYLDYSWQVQSADELPDHLFFEGDLDLEQRGLRWYFNGELPFSALLGSIIGGDVVSTVGRHTIRFELIVLGIGQPVATRDVVLDVGIPFSIWTQNTILRPNNPFVPNTGDDNEERANELLNRISQYDIVALQEVFDDEQRSQIAAGAIAQGYDLLWGPTEEGSCLNILKPCKEDSGLGLLIRGGLTSATLDPYSRLLQLRNTHHTELFGACGGDDCWSKKGFSSTFVPLKGADNFIRVLNTHLNSAGDTPGDFSGIRLDQLGQIMSHVSDLGPTEYPIVFVGDLNIVANGGESAAANAPGGPLSGWADVIFDKFSQLIPADPGGPFTIDQTRSAYAHFWDDHLSDHSADDPVDHPDNTERLDYILIRQGTEFHLEVDPVSISMTDENIMTDLCANEFPLADHPGMQCYLSDHYGMTANLRYIRAPETEPPPATPTPAPTAMPTPTPYVPPYIPDGENPCPFDPGAPAGCAAHLFAGDIGRSALAAGGAALMAPGMGVLGLILARRRRGPGDKITR